MHTSNEKPLPSAVKFFFGKVMPLGLALIGILAIYIGIRNVLNASASTSWPSVDGKISKSDVRMQTGSSGGQDVSSSGTYQADIEYDYVVDGEHLKGSRIAYGDHGTADRSYADSISSMYPEGISVTVFYKPDDHQVSLLEPGLSTSAWVPVFFGTPFLLIGIILLVFIPMTKKSTA